MAAAPDVRVRLSAEGVAEVVSALKKIRDEADATARKGGAGFKGFNAILGNATNLVGSLGLALSVGSFVGFIRSSAEAADQVGKLALKVGASVENLSALNLLAATADTTLEAVGGGLVKLNRSLQGLADNSPKVVAAFRSIKLGLSDFQGKDAAEAFELVSKGLISLESDALRTDVAFTILGKSSADLIPLMTDLADEGLSNVVARAKELGVLIDADLAAATARLNDDLALLNQQAKGLGAQFASGLAPSISQAVQIISGDLKQTTDSWKSFGEGVGAVLKFITFLVSDTFDIVGTQLGNLLISIDGIARSLVLIIQGRLKEAGEAFKLAQRSTEANTRDLAARSAARALLLTKSAPTSSATPRRTVGLTEPSDDATGNARNELARARLEAELAQVKANAKLRNDAEKRAFDDGLRSVAEYYANRRAIAEEESAAEIKAIQARIAINAQETDANKRAADGVRLEGELARARAQGTAIQTALLDDEAQAVRDLGDKRLALDRQLLEAAGQRRAAAQIEIEGQLVAAEKLFRQQGLADDERIQKLREARQILEGTADFEEAQARGRAALADLARGRALIDQLVATGQATQLEGQARTLELERSRLESLRDVATEISAIAAATGDPDKIAAAREFADAVGEIEAATMSAAATWKLFQDTIEQSATQELATVFATLGDGAESFGEKVKGALRGIIQAVRNLASQLIALQIIKAIGGGLSGAFSGGGQVKAADGGQILGPGTGTSDSIIARVSNREFIVRAAVVGQAGVLSHLTALNARGAGVLNEPTIRGIRRFAGGGLVSERADGKAGEARLTRAVIGLEPGLILRELDGPAGDRLQIKQLGRNRRAARNALGT